MTAIQQLLEGVKWLPLLWAMVCERGFHGVIRFRNAVGRVPGGCLGRGNREPRRCAAACGRLRQEVVDAAAACAAAYGQLASGNDVSTSDDDEMRDAARGQASFARELFKQWSHLDEDEIADALWDASLEIDARGLRRRGTARPRDLLRRQSWPISLIRQSQEIIRRRVR